MTVRAAAAAVAALLVLAACTTGADQVVTAPSPPPTPTPLPVPEASELPPAPDPDAPPAQGAPPEQGGPELLADCSDGDRAGIDAAVRGQLEAFADGDYERALGFATDGFRAARSPQDFEAIITEGFPIAADAASHATDTCRTDGARAAVGITVVSGGGEIGGFTYLLEREDDGVWRIAGAVPADTQGGVA